ncbi:MAG: 50S ribosomal protein L23 [Flavobacteriaceae bacterium]|jgi:large subunit ribosomal protein L23|nr:50S ribosomal protein L23 [Pelagibacterales bacterium]MBT4709691.1 50S ribosomal protein L23 [Flavobacteriaceae bacterium]MBT4958881.1 50S ribosomal protein L23 [Flavobacteriaceae bacterium]MBT6447625.1 50S ribosomal protein L23 [Flavobacteriaceae bacterium]MDG1831527.1 50S ribosomal protein L23 [Flavobacteriaceae bacterium]
MNILLKPVITEKATADSELKNRFTFLVDTDANKVQIKKAVETNYGVSVDKVRTMRYGAERKIRYTKTGIQRGKSARIKKAIVQLAEGDTIDFYNKL